MTVEALSAADLSRPLRLPPNRIRVFYQGGALIDQLRGVPDPHDDDRPEDWVGSATALGWPGRDPNDGVSTVTVAGRRVWLADLISRFPDAMLGADHARAFGSTPSLLVKLLDASIRLPVHSHPTGVFARRHLGSSHGKTEAWVVVGTRDAGVPPYVLLGLSAPLSREDLLDCVRRQAVDRLIASMHRLPVRAGDTIYVPAGIPHAIGPGVFIVELQEPSSQSILMEYEGFPVDPDAAHLGLGWALAVESVDRTVYARDEVMTRFVGHVPDGMHGVFDLFGAAAAPYFRAFHVRLRPGARAAFEAGFGVLIVLAGAGECRSPNGAVGLARGDQLLIPWAAGVSSIEAAAAGLDLILCLPPSEPPSPNASNA